jgi:hypothetical protein
MTTTTGSKNQNHRFRVVVSISIQTGAWMAARLGCDGRMGVGFHLENDG